MRDLFHQLHQARFITPTRLSIGLLVLMLSPIVAVRCDRFVILSGGGLLNERPLSGMLTLTSNFRDQGGPSPCREV